MTGCLLEPRKNPTMNAAKSTTIVILSIDAKKSCDFGLSAAYI